MMFVFAWCPSCLVFIWSPHPPYVPCFLLLFSMVSWWVTPPDFPLQLLNCSGSPCSLQKVFCNCNTTSRKLSVICSKNKSFLLKRLPSHSPWHQTPLLLAPSWQIFMWVKYQSDEKWIIYSPLYSESQIWYMSKNLGIPSLSQLLPKFPLDPFILRFSLM